MGLVDSVWAMTVNCWEQNPTQRPTMAAVVRFLRECYTLRAANLPLPTLAPWRPMGNVDDGANHTLISPVHAGGQQTPTQSPLYRDGHRALSNLALFVDNGSNPPTLNSRIPNQNLRTGNNPISPETPSPRVDDGYGRPPRAATFDGSNPLLMRTIFRTSSLPTQKDSYPPQSIGPGSGGNARIGVPKRQPRKKEKRPQKTGKALWKGLAAAIRFMVFVKRTPAEDYGG
jgi:hypothetical protein